MVSAYAYRQPTRSKSGSEDGREGQPGEKCLVGGGGLHPWDSEGGPI